jgi:hypothetical protein
MMVALSDVKLVRSWMGFELRDPRHKACLVQSFHLTVWIRKVAVEVAGRAACELSSARNHFRIVVVGKLERQARGSWPKRNTIGQNML